MRTDSYWNRMHVNSENGRVKEKRSPALCVKGRFHQLLETTFNQLEGSEKNLFDFHYPTDLHLSVVLPSFLILKDRHNSRFEYIGH